MDKQIQSRSGLNIGIESTLLPFVQAGAAELTVIPATGTEVTVMEHTDQAARVPFVSGSAQDFSSGLGGEGYVWNTDPSLPTGSVSFFFVDELGNEIQVATTNAPLSAAGPNPIFSPTFDLQSFFCLAPGEKIVAKFVPGGR